VKEDENDCIIIFLCDVGTLPFRYLGIPIYFCKIRSGEWKLPERSFLRKKMSSWIGKMLSYGDQLILIKSVLRSLPMFILSLLEIPK
jgi:hypothetical protein